MIATRFVAGFAGALAPALSFPHSGASRPQLAPDLRVLFHGAYAIYYLPLPDIVVVVRVLHGARDVAAIARRGDFRR